MKLIIAGHGDHGKDEVCKILERERGVTFTSSSKIASELFIFDALKDKYGYKTIEECHADRRNHRTEWHDLIVEYNSEDPARLLRQVFERCDIYNGIRNPDEFYAGKKEKQFYTSIWVDASQRKPSESEDSNKMKAKFCDHILDNNGPKEELEEIVLSLYDELYEQYKKDLAKQNELISKTRHTLRNSIVRAISKKSNFSQSKVDKLNQLFDQLENLSIVNAEVSTKMLTHDWPMMEEKLESLEKLALFFDKKYICTVNPEKSTKKEIKDNTSYFSLDNLIGMEENSDESTGRIDEQPEMSDEAKKGFETVDK